MRGKILYIATCIIIALPWLFLFEIWPIPYNRLSTFAEVLIEGSMFVLLMVDLTLLRKDSKRLKYSASEKNKSDLKFRRIVGKILFVLTSLTLFVVGLVLLLIGVSYTL